MGWRCWFTGLTGAAMCVGTASGCGSSGPGPATGAPDTGSASSGAVGTSASSGGGAGASSGAGGSGSGASSGVSPVAPADGGGGRPSDSGIVGSGGSGSGGGGSSSGVPSDGGGGARCAGDVNLPAEPAIPPPCATLQASLTVPAGGVPSESNFDTSRIQAALGSCTAGQSVRLTTSGANNAFITGPLTIPSNVTLWVDAGVTLYGTRNPSVYGSATGLITARGVNQGIAGAGIIDGQGGEPLVGGTGSFWAQNGAGGSSPALIVVSGATNFTLHGITLHNSPMFHVKLAAAGFLVWGVTVKTPSKPTNSAGTALTPSSAHNTDGIDPGEAASDGYIVCTNISVGDDQIAIKGGTGVKNLTIAHNHFLAGHGMSIGSETNGGVSNVNVYDLSIDGTNSGLGGGSSNGIRIKSDPGRGGLVTNISYSDVCVRNLANPIILNPFYSTTAGTSIPQFSAITIRNFHALAGSAGTITLDGFDPSHLTGITLDNVVFDGSHSVIASNASVTLGPGNVNFTPSGTNVMVTNAISGTSTPNPCTGKWVTF